MPHCLLIGKVYSPAVTQDNCPFPQIWTSTCSDNAMMMAPYVQPLHMKVSKHLQYILKASCDILWVGFMPHCLLIGEVNCPVMDKVCNPLVTHNVCSFPKSGLSPAVNASLLAYW